MSQLRPSPSESATLYKLNTKKRGNNGNMWEIVENKNGVKRWKEFKSKKVQKGKKYLVHDNGGRPFMVVVDKKTVSIYKNPQKDSSDIKNYTQHIKTYEGCTKIFIPEEGREKGNTVLLHFKNKYVFIGNVIYEFKIPKGEVITEYNSIIGNSDVPYPYAISKNYVYFLTEFEYVKRELIHNMDPYSDFYGFNGRKQLMNSKFAHTIKYKVVHERRW